MTAAAASSLLLRLEAALRRRYPELLAALRPGASAPAIARLQKLAGDRLPPSFYALLRWHDGCRDSTGLLDGLVWKSAAGMVELKKMMDDIVDAGHYAAFEPDEWWSKGWFLFADDESGYRSLVVDTHGSFDGHPGQVLSAAARDPTRIVVAPSFDAWLTTFVEIVEAGHLEREDDNYGFDRRAQRMFARERGYPRMCQPRSASVVSEPSAEGLGRPTRGAWPARVPDSARWLVAASEARVQHWLVDQTGATMSTWTGKDAGALKPAVKKWRTADAAAFAFDAALRKQLAAGFVFGSPDPVGPGEPLCALHVGDGSGAAAVDLAPDGRTLGFATTLAEARGARLYLADVETGRRTTLHEEQLAGGAQTFMHRVAFGPDGRRLYYQMNGRLCELASTGGAPKLLAEMDEAALNPFVTRFGFDRARERLLFFEGATIRVRRTAGKELLKISNRKKTCEYREVAISPSGELLALAYRSRGVMYGHEDAAHDTTSEIQIWSVDRKRQLLTLPYVGDMLRRLEFTPDDRELIVGDYNGIVALDLRTGARAWRRDAREWAFSPDGSQLAVIRHGIVVSILDVKTRRTRLIVDESRPWATSRAEIHDPAVMGYSADGRRLFLGNSGGRVYVWQVK